MLKCTVKPLIAEDSPETQAGSTQVCPVSVPRVTSSYPVAAAPFFLSISPASRQSDQFFGMARPRRPPDPYLARPVGELEPRTSKDLKAWNR